jgi:hypothetical protein
MSLFLQFLIETPSALIALIAVTLLGLYTFWIIARDRRRWRKWEKDMLKLKNERRAIFGLPPDKKYFD